MRMPAIMTCEECPVRRYAMFCNLEANARRRLESAAHVMPYPAAATLLVEGEPARGVFIVCSGSVKLTATAPGTGRTIVARVAKAGEVLGIAATMSGRPHALNAETAELCQAAFIRRDDFLRLVAEFGAVATRALEQLSNEVLDSSAKIRSLALCEPASAKLARLLDDWGRERGKPTEQGIRLTQLASHQAIGEMIGTSRETVTRQLGELKKRHIIEIKESTLVIRDPSALSIEASA